MSSLREMLSIKKRNILYYGASVTVQKDGFRPALHDLICRETGHHHDAIVNGIGGVGSMFCAGNLNYVLHKEYRVDLVVHECFTGDTNAGITSVELLPFFLENFCKVFENSEIIFVLNYRADRSFDELASVAKIYESIADKYGALVVSIYKDFHNQNFEGLTKEDAFRDGVHPTLVGANVIAGKIWNALRLTPSRLSHDQNDFAYVNMANQKIKFYCPDYLSKYINSKFSEGDFLYNNTNQTFKYMQFEDDFQINIDNSRILGFLALCGPRSPLFINVKLNQKVRKFRTFDRNSHYMRPQTYSWPNFLEASNLCFEFLPDQPDFSICSKFSESFSMQRALILGGIYLLT